MFLKDVVFERMEIVKEKDAVRIYFSEKIKPGLGQLRIEFNGQINENLNSFYKTRCMNRNGVSSYAAATQFEVFFFLLTFKLEIVRTENNFI